ncbi:ABC transporter permease [Brucella pseudogrignonensis]|uniref:ABC transporter permease n=1 Tax=Brucella pseudogrignonensis TaxID=419475 RepID=UPI003ECFED59
MFGISKERRLDHAGLTTRVIQPIRKILLRMRFDPLSIAGLILMIGGWFALLPVTPRSALPTPWGVMDAIVQKFWFHKTFAFYGLIDTGFFSALVYTSQNVLIAVLVGGAIGIVTGLIAARSSLVRAALDPIVLTLGTIPIIIAAPFLLLWLGGNRASAICTVGFYVAVILYTYAQRAVDNLNPTYEAAARTFGASRRSVLYDVLLPGTLPEILGGIRIALAGAWGLEAIVELLASQRGIGKLIRSITTASDIESLFAALLLLALTAAVFDAIVAVLFARITRWRLRPESN